MRFDREPWVKLYKHEGPQHRLMSLEARCFRDFLLRFAKTEDGVILERSTSPFRDLCKVIAAEVSCARRVKKWCKELIDVGYLTLSENGEVAVKRFVEAQEARSSNAERQARWKAKRKRERELAQTEEETEGNTLLVTSTGNAPDTLPRREEKRREEKRDPPPPPQGGEVQELQVPCPSPVLPSDVVEQLAGHYQLPVSSIQEAEKSFKNYWIAGKGAGKRFTRGVWMAKCREWIRRAVESGEIRGTGPTGANVETVVSP